MLAHSIVSVFLSKEWNPILQTKKVCEYDKDNTVGLRHFCYPVLIKGHHLLKVQASPLVQGEAHTCCLTCQQVMGGQTRMYGKLMLYCNYCLRTNNQTELYWRAKGFKDYLMFFLHQYYNINEAEAIICQAIAAKQHTFSNRHDTLVQLLDSL